jgi:gliding motility-associated-like protein
MLKRITLIFFLITISLTTHATHIVGGELYYKYLGNNQYQIMLTVYRDCYFGVPPFDDPAYIGVWNANNILVQTLSVSPYDSITIPNVINSPCFIPPVDVCYRAAYYSTTVSLPPISGGYQLTYMRCCRNQTILNIVSPLSTGATFYATIPGTPSQNSNPRFNSLPPPFVCAGLPFEFDHSAIDDDGDSLVYEICTPYNGASQTDPYPIPSSFPPPYSPVTYQPPYNLGNLLGGVPLAIDPQTGLLTCTPNTIGQFVIGVCVNEYRNGVLLSKSRRDYQLNVKACPTLVVAALQTPVLTCGSNTVQFVNNSFGASTYFWNFGDTTTLADTSVAVSPSYTYPGLGTYTVTLIAYSAFNPACADTTIGTVTIAPDYEVDFTYSQNTCSYEIQFDDSSNTASGVTTQWSWNFGDNSPIVTTADPVHTFPGPGTYTVTLQAVSALGCRETVVKTIVIPPFVTVTATNGSVTCTGLCTGQTTANISNGIQPVTYLWSDPQGQTTPTATGLCPGTYTVTVTDSLGCTATATATISNPAPLSSGISATNAYCDGLCIGTATVSPAGGTPPYSVVWDDPGGQTGITASNLCPGFYSAVITDANGCTTVTQPVEVLYDTFVPPLDAQISQDTIFIGQTVTLFANASGTFTYSWTPVTGLNNPNAQNPTANPTQNTTWYVTITDPLGCSNLDSVSVVVKEVTCVEPEIYIPNAFTPNLDSKNDILFVRGNTIRELDFKIYDRWGEKVFESNDPSKGWDGYYKGKLASPAVYVYYVEAVCFDNQRFFKKGNITLIR